MFIYWRVNFISPGIAGIACRAADATYGPEIWQAAEKSTFGAPNFGPWGHQISLANSEPLQDGAPSRARSREPLPNRKVAE